ncbi:MAG TPA: hypothetical protein VHO70_09155 [Chitinispirillaceae bacterium]|nr:hypothetical protein [Chitinispirillaceae bacterium]
MINYYANTPDIIPKSVHQPSAVFTCAYNGEQQCPGAVLSCDNVTENLTGLSRQKILTCTFFDLCKDAPTLTPSDLNKTIYFRSELKTFAGPVLPCDFCITCMYNFDTLFLQIMAQPVGYEKPYGNRSEIIPANKLDTLDILSHGLTHGINNSINLITLSSDLLRELFDELISHFGPGTETSIRGMAIPDLSKMTQQLTDNLLKSATRVSATSQALVHYLKNNQELSNYDIRKILQTAVLLTEYEILKSSYEFVYEPPQGIIKRTGNQYEILQAIFNCLIFLCSNARGRKGRFSITTKVRPEQNDFCIYIQHDACALSDQDLNVIKQYKGQGYEFQQDHPLSVASSLISMNSGDFEVLHDKSGCVKITITLSSVSTY